MKAIWYRINGENLPVTVIEWIDDDLAIIEIPLKHSYRMERRVVPKSSLTFET